MRGYDDLIYENAYLNKIGKFYDDEFEDKQDFSLELLEASGQTFIFHDGIYPTVDKVLSSAPGSAKFLRLVNEYIDRNLERLNAQGPTVICAFTDVDKEAFYELFGIDDKEIKKLITEVTKNISASANFRLLNQNPIYVLFYMCIRFYSLKASKLRTRDYQIQLGSALTIYALAAYPSIYTKYWKYGYADAEVMTYTIDTLSNKYIFKQEAHVLGALTHSIKSSYEFLKDSIEKNDSDVEVIRFVQRIRNDQNSMFKKLYDQYKTNYNNGNRITNQKDSYDDQLVDDNYNNTSSVELVTRKVSLSVLTNGVDLQRAQIAAKLSGISIADCRLYMSRIVTDKYTDEISNFIESVLFLYLYGENKKISDINSKMFLEWSAKLFRMTNSNDKNIATIKQTLDKWGEEVGVHAKFKREASRVNYKKAIFYYFILSIQSYTS